MPTNASSASNGAQTETHERLAPHGAATTTATTENELVTPKENAVNTTNTATAAAAGSDSIVSDADELASQTSAAPRKKTKKNKSTAVIPPTSTITVLTSSARRNRGGVTAVAVTTKRSKAPATIPATTTTTSAARTAAQPSSSSAAPATRHASTGDGARRAREAPSSGAHPAQAHLARVASKRAEPHRTTMDSAHSLSDNEDHPHHKTGAAPQTAEEFSSVSTHPDSMTGATATDSAASPPPRPPQTPSRHHRTQSDSKDKSRPLSARSSDSQTTSSSVSSTPSGTAAARSGVDGGSDGRYKVTLANLHAKRAKHTPALAGADTRTRKPKSKKPAAPSSSAVAPESKKRSVPPPAITTITAAASPESMPLTHVLARMRSVLIRQHNLFSRVDQAVATVARDAPCPAHEDVQVPVARQPVTMSPLPSVSRLSFSDVTDHADSTRRPHTPEDVEDTILSPFSQTSLSPQSHPSFSPTLVHRSGSSGFAAQNGLHEHVTLPPPPPPPPTAAAPGLSTFPRLQTLASPGSSITSPVATGAPHASDNATLTTAAVVIPVETAGSSSPGPLAGGRSQPSMLSVSPVSLSSSPSASTTSTPSSIPSIPTSLSDHDFHRESPVHTADVSPLPTGVRTSAALTSVESSHVAEVSTSTSPSASPSSYTSSGTPPPLATDGARGGSGAGSLAALRDGRRTAWGPVASSGPPTALTSSCSSIVDGEGGSGRRWAIPPVRVVRRPPIAPVNRPSPLRKSSSHRSDSLYTTTSSSNTNSPCQADVDLYLRANARLEEEETLEQQHRLQTIFEQQLRQCNEEETLWLGAMAHTHGGPMNSPTALTPTITSSPLPAPRLVEGGDGNDLGESFTSLSFTVTDSTGAGGRVGAGGVDSRDDLMACDNDNDDDDDDDDRAMDETASECEADPQGESGHSPRSPQPLRVQVLTLNSSAHSRRYVRRRRRHLLNTRHGHNGSLGGGGGGGGWAGGGGGSPPSLGASGLAEGRAVSPQTDDDERRFDSRMAEIERFQAANRKALRGRREDLDTAHKEGDLSLSASDLTSPSGAPRGSRGVRGSGGVSVITSGARRRPKSASAVAGASGKRPSTGSAGTLRQRGARDPAHVTDDPAHASDLHATSVTPNSATPEEIDLGSAEWAAWTPLSSSLASASPHVVSPGRTEMVTTEPIPDKAGPATTTKTAADVTSAPPFADRDEAEAEATAASVEDDDDEADVNAMRRGATHTVPPLSLALIVEATDRCRRSHSVAKVKPAVLTSTKRPPTSAPSKATSPAASSTKASASASGAGGVMTATTETGESRAVSGRTSGTSTPSQVALSSPRDDDDGADARPGAGDHAEHAASSLAGTGTGPSPTTRTPRFRLARTPRGTTQPNMLGRRRSSAKTALVSLMTSPGAVSAVASSSNGSTPMAAAGGGGGRRRRRASQPLPPSSTTRRNKLAAAQHPPTTTSTTTAITAESPLVSAHTSEPSTSPPRSGPSEPSNSPILLASSQPTSRPRTSPPPPALPRQQADETTPTPAEVSKSTAHSPSGATGSTGTLRRRSQTVVEKPKTSTTATSTAPISREAAVRPRRASMPTLPTSGWQRASGSGPVATRTAMAPTTTTTAGKSNNNTTNATNATNTMRARGEPAELSSTTPAPRRRASLGDVPSSFATNGRPPHTRSTAGHVPPPRRRSLNGPSAENDTAPMAHFHKKSTDLGEGDGDDDGDGRRQSNSTAGLPSSNASAHSPPHRRGTAVGTTTAASTEIRSPLDSAADLGALPSVTDDAHARAIQTPSDVGEVLSDDPDTPLDPYHFPTSPDASGASAPARSLSPLRRSRSDSAALRSPPRLRRGRESEGATPLEPTTTTTTTTTTTSTSLSATGQTLRWDKTKPTASSTQARRHTYQSGTGETPAAPTASSASTSPAVSPSFMRYQQRLSRRDGPRTKAMEDLLLSGSVQSQLLSGAPSPLVLASAMSSTDAPTVESTAAPSVGTSSTSPLSRPVAPAEHSPLRSSNGDGRLERASPPTVTLTQSASEEEGEGSGGRGATSPVRAPALSSNHANAPLSTAASPTVDRRRRLQTRMTPKPNVSSPSAAAAKVKNGGA